MYKKNEERKKKFTSQNKKYLPETKKALLEKLPKVSYSEVRRARIPFHEAITSEFRENNHVDSLNIWLGLLKIDEDKSISDPSRNRIISSKKILQNLSNQLLKTEMLNDALDMDAKVKIFQEIIEEFSNDHEDFYWIADEFHRKSIEIYEVHEDAKSEKSRLSFMYANFLKNKIKDLEKAVNYYKITKESFGHKRSSLFDIDEILMYHQIIVNYCEAVIELAWKVSTESPEKAFEYIQIASGLTRENPRHTTKFMIQIGDFYFKFERFEEAMKFFLKVLNVDIDDDLNMIEHFCLAAMKIGFCHKELGNLEEAKEYLQQAIVIAKGSELLELLGDASMLLGKILLQQEQYENAEQLLLDSEKIFESLNMTKKQGMVMIMKAPITAQKTFNDVVDRIVKADKGPKRNNEDVLRLMKWYDRKMPIWTLRDVEALSTSQLKPEDLDLDVFIRNYYQSDEVLAM